MGPTERKKCCNPHFHPLFLTGAGGEVQTYQIRTAPTSSPLSQTVVMSPSLGLSQKTDDPTMKREIRLMKNR